MAKRTKREKEMRDFVIAAWCRDEHTVPGKMFSMAQAAAEFDLMVKEVKRKALLDAAKEIRHHLDPDKVGKAQQGRIKYAIGFLEASAEEYSNERQ